MANPDLLFPSEQFGLLAPHDRAYLAGLDAQRRDPQHVNVRIGENFIPSSLMTESERRDFLGVVPYEMLNGNEHYLSAATEVHVRFHPMDAGLGTSVVRDDYLEEMANYVDRTTLDGKKGSKSSDLYLPYMQDGSIAYMSIAEVKIRRIIENSKRYVGISLTPIVNSDSKPAMQSVYDLYEEYFNENNILNGRWLMQGDLPTWDVEQKKFSTEHTAPGGHGQAGVMLLHEIMDSEDTTAPTVRAIFNGDGPNNFVTPEMVAYTAQEAGIVMVTTTRTSADVKGGIIGGKVHEDGSMTPDICELAQARKAAQTELFMKLGLQEEFSDGDIPEGRVHTPGDQYFNSNTALMNESVLRPFLKVLKAEMSPEAFDQLLTPELMLNTKEKNGKKFDQLEGALGSLILRLNEAVLHDDTVRSAWEAVSGGRQFLKIINTSPQDRDETFTPNKFPVDFMLQSSSNHFMLNTNTWELENQKPGHLPRFEGDFVGKGYWSNVKNVLGSFGYADATELDELHVEGNFMMANAIHGGTERIICRYTPRNEGDIFDLNSPAARAQLGQRGVNPLNLSNLHIEVDEFGTISHRKIN